MSSAYVKGRVPGLVLLAALAVGAAGCSGGGSGEDGADDAKAGGSAVPAAQPGKYRTLPEPCRIVERSLLKTMLPGGAELPEDQQRKLFAGEPAVTFDTDRRVGCRWKAESPEATHQLSVAFDRVVSYDDAVSDDDRAQAVYAKLLDAADLPVPPDPVASSGSPTGSPETSGRPDGHGAQSGPPSGSPSAPPSSTGASGSPSGTATPPADPDLAELQPRTLGGLGDAAFLNDELKKAGASPARDRTVSVVFRTSNVVVSIEYGEQPGGGGQVPDSRTLQDRAQTLARKLAEQFSDSE
ncbi:DUF3558 domain-containing protein [Streptomyces sp. CA-294286]|uniref:DUF3558 domain-containing protein n=1 Tax=Streptomyces sp. CA-294286 TaxID=3240070 RepID=UPI003D89C5AD